MNTDMYRYKYDLHVHTSPVSRCGDFSPREVVDRYVSAGFQGIVITNHFSFAAMNTLKSKEEYLNFYLSDYYEARSYGKEKGLDVLLGAEMRFPENDNDYLVYGINEKDLFSAYDYLFTEYEKFYDEFKNGHNIIIQAHPFRSSCNLQSLDIIDGIEVFNMHPGHNSRVAVAAKTAYENPHLLVTGGSDFHHENHQAMCGVCLKERVTDSFAMAKVIKSRDFIFDIWGNKIVPSNNNL